MPDLKSRAQLPHLPYPKMNVTRTINAHRAAAGGGLLESLVAYYALNETSGAIASDAHGDNDGTVTGATINVTGKIDKCYSFDGSNDSVDLGTWFDLSNDDFSISLWANINSTAANKYVAMGFSQSGNVGEPYWLFMHRADKGGWTLQTDVGAVALATWPSISTGASASTWDHLVLVRNRTAGSLSIWRNGTEYDDSSYDPTFESDHSSGTLHIGNWYSGGNLSFAGKIDEVGIFSKALTGSEISDLYNAGSGITYGDL